MFESDLAWLEFVTQLFIIFPMYSLVDRFVGFRKMRGSVPDWFLGMLVYAVSKIFSTVLQYAPLFFAHVPENVTMIRGIITLFILFVIFPRFLEGSYLKVYLFLFLSEILSVAAYLMRGFAMLALRRLGIYAILAETIWLFLPVRIFMELAPYYLLMWALRRPIRWYREHEIQRRALAGTAVGLLVFLEICGLVTDLEHVGDMRLILGSLVLCGMAALFAYYQMQENERMIVCQKLLENHYRSVLNQTSQIDDVRERIFRLIGQVDEMEKNGGFTDLDKYMEELKRIHGTLQRTEYSEHLLIDALLQNKKRECQEKGIGMDIEMQILLADDKSAQELFQILSDLLELAADVVAADAVESSAVASPAVVSPAEIAGSALQKFPGDRNRNQNIQTGHRNTQPGEQNARQGEQNAWSCEQNVRQGNEEKETGKENGSTSKKQISVKGAIVSGRKLIEIRFSGIRPDCDMEKRLCRIKRSAIRLGGRCVWDAAGKKIKMMY